MNPIFTSLTLYLFLFFFIKVAGKKTLASTTTFDIVLILIIAECVDQSLISYDFSLTNALIIITNFFGITYFLTRVALKSKKFDQTLNSTPLILVNEGTPLKERLIKSNIHLDDILEAARQLHGIERLDQIKYAILEKNGSLSIIKGT